MGLIRGRHGLFAVQHAVESGRRSLGVKCMIGEVGGSGGRNEVGLVEETRTNVYVGMCIVLRFPCVDAFPSGRQQYLY